MTFIGTATAILDIDGVRFLTDPFFSPAGTEFDIGLTVLKNEESPALRLEDLPPIDAILLSHEDHPDNLDPPWASTFGWPSCVDDNGWRVKPCSSSCCPRP